jgi:hypothetical protein
MLAIDHNGAVLGYLALLGVRFLMLPPLFKLDLLNSARDDLLNKLVGLAVLHLVVVCLTLIWQDDVALLRAGGILDSIASSDTLPVLNHMMLGRCILHVNQSSGR